MTAPAPQVSRTRIAVFGSISAGRTDTSPEKVPVLSPAARAVLERVLDSITSSVPSIAGPILDRAVAEGTITRSERHELLQELSDPAALPGAVPASVGGRRVLREALAAVRRAAPGIAGPILEDAVDAERLTAAQQRRILERLGTSPVRALRAPGRGPLGARVAGGVS